MDIWTTSEPRWSCHTKQVKVVVSKREEREFTVYDGQGYKDRSRENKQTWIKVQKEVLQNAETGLESTVMLVGCLSHQVTTDLIHTLSFQVWFSRLTKMALCHPTFCTKLDKTPALRRRPMKSDGPTGVPGPTLGGNSTSSTVLFGYKVSDWNAMLPEYVYTVYMIQAGLNIDLIHHLHDYIWFAALLPWLESERILWTCFSAVCSWQQLVL